MLIVLACVPVAIWVFLLVGRYGFWQVWRLFAPTPKVDISPSSVVAIIPARNEAAGIARAVRSLREQDYAALLRIIVVDDNSEDGTGNLARGAGTDVVPGSSLPAGWTGKMWAVAQGVAEAEKLNPEFLLLTDADIEHARENLAELMRIAQSGGYDLASYMVKLNCETAPEKLLIPAFVFFFFLLYPPKAIRSPKSRVAGAAGGCMLIRTAALRIAGGIEAIRSEVIDDCALAKAVKCSGGRVWLGVTLDTRSLRKYATWAEIEKMISRTAFNQLQHSWVLLAGTCASLILTYFVPLALIFSGHLVPAMLGTAAWLLMSIAYAPMVRFYERSLLCSLTLPFAALFYAAATIHSAVQYASGRGGQWKGRAQDVTTGR